MTSTPLLVYMYNDHDQICKQTNLHSEPQEKLPWSNRRARNFLLPPLVLTVWILLGPSC